MEFCSLTSGSSGNCLFIREGTTKILIDCGLSGKKTAELLSEIGEDINNINAVLVTHEHSDHISGVGVLSRKYNIPVYIKQETYYNSDKPMNNLNFFETDFEIGNLKIHSFKTSHDAVNPVGYVLSSGTSKMCILTDTGVVTREMYSNFKDCNFAFVESNHDVDILRANPNYSYPLKQRILSDKGHLSNKMCADIVCSMVSDGISTIMLGHLSNENNTPEIAYETSHSALLISGFKDSDFDLSVASRTSPSKIISF